MFSASETPVIATILLVAVGILGWGFYKAKPYGKLGLLSWLQSVVLMIPWLVFFGLFAAGIYVNIAGILLIIMVATSIYIYLGRQLRAEGRHKVLQQNADQRSLTSQSQEKKQQRDKEESTEAPSQLQPKLISIPGEDLNSIKGIFGIDTFFVTNTTAYLEGAIFEGNLRGEPGKTHNILRNTLKKRFDEKYRLFLVENRDGKPVVIVLPSKNDPQPMTFTQQVFAGILFIATIITCMEVVGIILYFDLFSNPRRYMETIPIAVGVMVILLAHEIAHKIVANWYQVRLSLPYFLPAVQIGSFGAITRFESLLPNRKVLFDIAIAGPAVGGILSLVILVIGLLLSHPGSLFQLPNTFFQGSILVGSLARVILGSNVQSSVVDVSPLVIIGWLGLVISAINLMPAGHLDGGRIVQAIYGRKTANRTTFATVILLALISLGNSLAMYWVIVILFLQRNLERPSLDEISEPDDARAVLGLLALFLMIITLLPLTPSLAGRLGLGGS
ncbi:MAG TPA: site-2 protease family protein [Richelia sp.]|nr:site-2 protease family protein [Richelia sp.]